VTASEEAASVGVMPSTEDATCFKKLDEDVKMVLQQCTEACLGKITAFQSAQVDDWSDRIGQDVIGKLQEMNINFKYIANVSIMEKRGQGFHTSVATHWDAEADGVSHLQHGEDVGRHVVNCRVRRPAV